MRQQFEKETGWGVVVKNNIRQGIRKHEDGGNQHCSYQYYLGVYSQWLEAQVESQIHPQVMETKLCEINEDLILANQKLESKNKQVEELKDEFLVFVQKVDDAAHTPAYLQDDIKELKAKLK